MSDNILAAFFALLSALVIAWGTVVRHNVVIASDKPLRAAMKAPMWWAGFSTALIGYGLQVIALSYGPLLVVQPVLVLSLMFTLMLSARMDRRPLNTQEGSWSLLLSIAVTGILIIGRPVESDDSPTPIRWIVAITAGLIIMSIMALIAKKRKERALILGLVTGAIFGYVAVFSKAFVTVLTTQGPLATIASWETWALIAGAIIGTAVQQYSFNAGPLAQSLPAMTIGEPIVAFSLGVFVLGETLSTTTTLGYLVLAVALVAMVVSTWKLSNVSYST